MYSSRKPIRSWAAWVGLALVLAAFCLWCAGCGKPAQVLSPSTPSAPGQPATSGPVKYPQPKVSDLSFTTFKFTPPTMKYKSAWNLRTSSYDLSLDGSALKCEFSAPSAADKSVYTGVMVPLKEPKALKLDISFDHPDAFVVFYVDAYTARPGGKAAIRWEWRSMPGREITAARATYALVPGKGSGFFRSTAGADPSGVVKVEIFGRLKLGASGRFTIHKIEAAN